MYILGVVHQRPGGLPMEATIFNQIKCYMMYIFEPLRSCTMYLLTCHGHSWTLVASNGLKFLKKMDFLRYGRTFFSIFSSALDQICLGDLKKVYCQSSSLEARLTSMEATIYNQIKPNMMYIFEPLRKWKMHLFTHHGHS